MEKFNWETLKIVTRQGDISYISTEQYKDQKIRLKIANQFNSLQEFYCLSLIYENPSIFIFLAYDNLTEQYCHHIIPKERSIYKKQILNSIHLS